MNSDDMKENYKLAKWLSGEMTDEELAAFKAEPDFAVFEKIKHYSAALETPALDEQKMLATIVSKPKSPVKTLSLHQHWVFRVAAVAVLVLGFFFTFQIFGTATEIAENGQQNRFSLPDNSEVVMNAGSEIEYKKWNWSNNRQLTLNGEAYFKVAKGQRFEVNTSLGKVTVLGTQFNVKQRGDRFDVHCYEGKVKVTYQDKETIITKGMSVAFKNGQSLTIPQTTIESPEWLNNEMVFYQEDLKSVVSEFERHFDVTLELKTKVSPQLFTGTIPANDIDVALQVLSASYHLKASKVGENKYIVTAVDAQQ